LSREKLQIHETDASILIGNLRGEIGEIVTSWILLRGIHAEIRLERREKADELSKHPEGEFDNPVLVRLSLLSGKLHDEIVGRLSEVAEKKIGRLTFHFAAVKLGRLEKEVRTFATFIEKQRFTKKRNYDISHKVLPAKFTDHKYIDVPFRILSRGVAMALRLMKKIDRAHLGPSSPFLWSEMRRRRYRLSHPASTLYALMPYIKPRDKDRIGIILAEMAAGESVWSDMPTSINGQPAFVRVCRKWGAVLVPDGILLTTEYPLHSIKFDYPVAQAGDPATPVPSQGSTQRLEEASNHRDSEDAEKTSVFSVPLWLIDF
jgi:hypothetical protein